MTDKVVELEYQSNYDEAMRSVFPHKIYATKGELERIARTLTLRTRVDVPLGSSFAVVSGIGATGTAAGKVTVYLSNVSFNFLQKKALISSRGEVIAPRSAVGTQG